MGNKRLNYRYVVDVVAVGPNECEVTQRKTPNKFQAQEKTIEEKITKNTTTSYVCTILSVFTTKQYNCTYDDSS